LIDVIGEVVLEAALALPRYEKHANLWKNVVKTPPQLGRHPEGSNGSGFFAAQYIL
jgi:hypothetical protein